MKKSLFAVAVSLFLAAAARADIIVSEVNPAGSGATAYGKDWFELTNTGGTEVDITGWKVDDSSNSFASALALNGFNKIAAGQSIVFIEAASDGSDFATVSAAFQTAWFGKSTQPGFSIGWYGGSGIGLSTSGDAINIFDGSGAVKANVTFGAFTLGATLDNAAGLNNQQISQLSAVGVNGAFTSFDGIEIGSPGTIGATAAVPEPSSLALIGFAVGGMGYRTLRRRMRASVVAA